MLSREETERRCGFAIPDDWWYFWPWGHRILIRRQSPEETYGVIIIPTAARRQISAGVIVKVGPSVGILDGQPGAAVIPSRFCKTEKSDSDMEYELPDPDSLVGEVVTFGHFAGYALGPATKHSVTEDTYDTEYVLIQAIDVWGDNEAPPKEKTNQ